MRLDALVLAFLITVDMMIYGPYYVGTCLCLERRNNRLRDVLQRSRQYFLINQDNMEFENYSLQPSRGYEFRAQDVPASHPPTRQRTCAVNRPSLHWDCPPRS